MASLPRIRQSLSGHSLRDRRLRGEIGNDSEPSTGREGAPNRTEEEDPSGVLDPDVDRRSRRRYVDIDGWTAGTGHASPDCVSSRRNRNLTRLTPTEPAHGLMINPHQVSATLVPPAARPVEQDPNLLCHADI